MARRVVITGLGTINPTGHNVKESWDNITNGRTGIAPIASFDTTNFLVKVAGEVKDFDPAQHMEAREARRRDRYQQFATVAAKEALAQSGLVVTPENAARVAVLINSAVGGIKALQDAVRATFEAGPRKINPFTIPMLMSNGAGGLVAIDIGAKGPNFSVSSACASANDGMGIAWHLMRSGVMDAAVIGGSDATVLEVGIGAFDRLGAMSHRTEAIPQPFDKERDGVVMGEGAACLVIETLEHAQGRGATILAELAGYGVTADAFHITAPAEDGATGAAAMTQALAAAELNAADLGYISAHGTGTPLNDAAETAAVKRAFGEQAYRIPISSSKSMTGHMMGATGAVEAVFCVQAITTGVLPPTINYRTPDPACDLDYVPNTAREARVNAALSNAFGFGGHNAVLAFKRFTG
ncbi:MAG: beta-ketoacyl-ACP synthase II [Anaerolineales bacterium]|nr:beta-ketoacyl-ACP synthase II [Anaerolineales bacterium]